MSTDPLPTTKPIPPDEFQLKLEIARKFHEVARPGQERPSAQDLKTAPVHFNWWLISSQGAGFELLREPHHTDADIAAAADYIRNDRDCLHLHVAVPETRYQRECRFLEEHLQPLAGKTVKEIVREQNSEADYGKPVYGLEFTDGTTTWIMQDPEGNGPGHLSIELPEETPGHRQPPTYAELLDLLTRAFPHVEDAIADPVYKKGVMAKFAAEIRSAIEATEPTTKAG